MFFKSFLSVLSAAAVVLLGLTYKDQLPFINPPKQVQVTPKKTEILKAGETPAVIQPVTYNSPPLKDITSFGYYTSQVNPDYVAKSAYPLIIVNEADKNSVLFTKEAVATMKGKNKIILAEISFGYAETYRWYFKKEWIQSPPSFLGFKLNDSKYVVQDWLNQEWMAISKKMIDLAVEAGYNGIVLDGPAVYIELGAAKTMRDKMVDYVVTLSQYAKSKNKDFLILPKNAELLGSIPQYAAAIDGIIKEDLIYSTFSNGVSGPKNNDDQIVKGIRDLNEFKKTGKPVFVIEFVSGKLWEDANARLKNNKLVGYSSPSRAPSSLR